MKQSPVGAAAPQDLTQRRLEFLAKIFDADSGQVLVALTKLARGEQPGLERRLAS